MKRKRTVKMSKNQVNRLLEQQGYKLEEENGELVMVRTNKEE